MAPGPSHCGYSRRHYSDSRSTGFKTKTNQLYNDYGCAALMSMFFQQLASCIMNSTKVYVNVHFPYSHIFYWEKQKLILYIHIWNSSSANIIKQQIQYNEA